MDEDDEKLFDNKMSRCTNIVGIRPTGWSFRNDRKPRSSNKYNQAISNGANRNDEEGLGLGVLTKYKPFIRYHEDDNSTSSLIGTSYNVTDSNVKIKSSNTGEVRPQIKKTKSYSIPYSEHSSYWRP